MKAAEEALIDSKLIGSEGDTSINQVDRLRIVSSCVD